ncbi:LOW QUALITY PROTEIN: Hypothetical protein PHPALM_17670 [Phytophthora palmivora]|uniref:Uncharacterized protein n=1 Tax=Phytophthora palmivora TaxID=4796 RepID=A0A2P4XLR0_9STRA|nr:LOW QUALITY PROTEIN: Hypothetical protein PHPALM_17670 [Phytophthora palmivora]
MSLNDLAPTNTRSARENAFLEDEEVEWKYLEEFMQRENAAHILEAVVDKFDMHPAFKEGRIGNLLARRSFPQHRTAVDKSLLKKGQVLERHYMKRESGAFVNKAPTCTKSALKRMMEYLYSTAANLSIRSGDIFFVRFIFIKTSEESLFPDDDFATCPILAIIVALATQAAHDVARLSQILAKGTQSEIAPATPLIDLLDHPEAVTSSILWQIVRRVKMLHPAFTAT